MRERETSTCRRRACAEKRERERVLVRVDIYGTQPRRKTSDNKNVKQSVSDTVCVSQKRS